MENCTPITTLMSVCICVHVMFDYSRSYYGTEGFMVCVVSIQYMIKERLRN